MIPVSNSEIRERFSARTGLEPTETLMAERGTDFELHALAGDTMLFSYRFRDLRRSLAYRIFHDPGRTYTRSYQVNVEGAPEIVKSEFRVIPPDYTGLSERDMAGPPRSVSGLPGSLIKVDLALDRSVSNLFWDVQGGSVRFERTDARNWTAGVELRESGTYEIYTAPDEGGHRQPVASGNMLAERDEPPSVEFVTDRLNREVWPGQVIELKIRALDDYGVSEIALEAGLSHGSSEAVEEVARWGLEGPPGRKEPEVVRYMLRVDPSRFAPGDEYLLRAFARDFHPDRQQGRSIPLMLRVRDIEDVPDGFDFSSAFEALERAIAEQRRALSNTRTVSNYMDSVLGRDPDQPSFTFYNHRDRMDMRQRRVNDLLAVVAREATVSGPGYLRDARQVRYDLAVPLADRISALAGDAGPWFDSGAHVVRNGSYINEGEGWHRITFPRMQARYAGIRFSGHGSRFAVSNLEFLDGRGEALPPPYVNRFRLSSVYNAWDGPVGFASVTRSDLERIVAGALNSPLRGSESELVDLRGMVSGAPDRNVALYAVRIIRCEEPRRVFMYAGASDSLRIWVNDSVVVNRLERRRAGADQERVGVRLHEGENVVVAEVSAAGYPPALAMRFTERDGTALALTEDGRLVRAPVPEVVHAGASPDTAVNLTDYDSGTVWRVEGGSPCLFIVDIGHSREISGLRIRAAGRHAFESYDLYAAGDLRIYGTLPGYIAGIEQKQVEVLDRLAAIRTAWLEDRDDAAAVVEKPVREAPWVDDSPPAVVLQGHFERLVAELLERCEESQELSGRRKSMLDLFGDDFTMEDTARLQDIKDRERRIAQHMRDIVQDMSAIGDLDLAHATQVSDVQEIRESSKELADIMTQKAEKDILDLTHSLDTRAQELYEEITQHGEVFFGTTDDQQSAQELAEDMKTPIPLQELPQTLSDVVGEMEEGLIEFEDEAQTVGSMLHSLEGDEGVIAPGEMASASALGKTGDEPPDAARELEGRSGFGRTGRASGEGVADVAEDIPQDSVAPPERDTGGSIEDGMVEDRSTEAAAEGTGIGKETDDTEEFGMGGGDLPPAILDRMRGIAGGQIELRETAGMMLLELQRHNLPSADLNRALEALDKLEKAADEEDLHTFRQAYDEALNHMSAAERAVGREVGRQHLRGQRHALERAETSYDAVQIPESYRDIVAEYFKALAEEDDDDE